MKKIIKNKIYDTDKARKVGEWESVHIVGDLDWCSETLYRKRTGEYFLDGEGGARSRYAESLGGGSWTGGRKIIPFSYDAARAWAEEHLTADEYLAEFELPPDDDSIVNKNMNLSAKTTALLDRLRAKTGKTYEGVIADLLAKAEE